MYIIVLDRLIQRLFHVMLYGEVDGRDKVEAVLCAGVALILVKQQIGAVGICKAHVSAGDAAQRGIVLRLYPVKAVVVRSDKAYDVAGKRRIRIVALCVAFKADALESIFVFELAHLIGRFLFDLARKSDIPRAAVLSLFEYILALKSEDN